MNIDALKLSLLTYVKHFGLYDYLAFGWLLFTFLALIILASLIAKKSSVASLFMIIIALILLVVSPFFIKLKLSEITRATTTEISLVKKLTFSDSLIVEGSITNHSTKDFSLCLVHTTVFKQTDAQGIKAFINRLKPIANQSILVKQTLLKEGVMEFQSVFDDFVYSGDVNASLSAECY
ncbi:DUF2393 family protein [Sulfurospirillum multivorans]|uniref:DUF2393 domain-containing protein n=2 Tax=Sulfurospirillum multivorans TaxID=66821 RepID=A0AA86DYL7_SULMK|nr:DUF2393 family protein [Sulfurospirillum multivorans]AHJ11520.1 hypothetical protein SMUL_0238 [Sulfurospirillum multivorans DSM 12446]QEH05021.1 hypothetical protein SMN_0232 [Sulfurospirillum multivorans]